MKAWLLLGATVPLFTGCMVSVESGTSSTQSQSSLPYGNGVLALETRSLPAFNAVETHGDFKVLIQEGSRNEVTIQADENLTGYVSTDVRDGRLIVDWSNSVQETIAPTLTVTVPALNEVHLYGSGDVNVDQTSWREAMTLDAAGPGTLQYSGASGQINASVGGFGNLELTGYADALNATTQGTGNLFADGLLTADAYAENSGSGDITLDLDQDAWLTARVNGSGNVEWWGLPAKTTYDLNGSGRVIEHRVLAKSSSQSKVTAKYKAMKPK